MPKEINSSISNMFLNAFEYDYKTMEINKRYDVYDKGVSIKSFDSTTNSVVFKKVKNIVRKKDAVKVVTTLSNSKKLETSLNHKFFIRLFLDKKPYYEEVENILKIKTHVYLFDGEAWIKIKNIELTDEFTPILDLEVEDTHNYFSNGVLSHNTIYGSPETTPGGNAMKFYASTRLDVRKSAGEKDKDGNVLTSHVKVKTVKNKLAPPFQVTEFEIVFGQGIDRNSEIINIAVANDIIQKSGSWYSYGDVKLGQGESGVRSMLADNPELAQEIEAKIRTLFEI